MELYLAEIDIRIYNDNTDIEVKESTVLRLVWASSRKDAKRYIYGHFKQDDSSNISIDVLKIDLNEAIGLYPVLEN